ncbi:methyl-accepting chemotaxis protein [Citreimonas salinaria]|uniref:Methyl-accepting chemotaxis sensory transducer n=1 Tax=Citreimonas salinaria TaxID=321339 RepID=A0A1H3IGD8_9RHOB|nr:methyl-accepting chemotaxis protein [Citreimonas salinaria]SDY26760.1 methyl-accepting chemotaxis sensory transducer [Citreimonas salinaria]
MKIASFLRGITPAGIVVFVACALAVLNIGAELFLGLSVVTTVLSVLVAGAAVVSARLKTGLTDYVLSLALVAQSAIFTATFTGHAWQIDTHMLYFLVLACVSVLGRVGPLLAACGVIAVHHAGFSLLMPALVFPSVTLAENLLRTGLHGVLVLLETGALALSIAQRNTMAARAEAATWDATEEAGRAQAARDDAQRRADETDAAVAVLRAHLSRLADRDLDCPIDSTLPVEFADVGDDFNRAVSQLSEAIGSAQSMARGFAREAEALQSVTGSLSTRSEEQALALSEVNSGIGAVSERLAAAAAQADDAANAASRTRSEAEEGGVVTDRAIAAMNLIESSTSEVAKIMDLIDDIAFQTNLLSLNAGVEAARAGESGRGFAVVASEVRGLAQRTAEAASGVKELIAKSASHVSDGAALVNETGDRLSRIVDQVKAVSGMIETIRDGSQAQSADISSLSQTVADLDGRTQATAGQSEELAAMGMRLRSDAEELAQSMAAFHQVGVRQGRHAA